MEDTATHFKCFPSSPNRTNKSAGNSSPCWFFTLLNPSNRKINVISPQEDQVSNELQAGETVSKEEHDRVLLERNSLKDQLSRKNEEINKLEDHVRRLTSELWFLSDSYPAVNLSHVQDEAGSSSNNKDQLSVTTAESNVVNSDQNKGKAIQEAKTQPVVRVRLIGARASSLPPLNRTTQAGGTRTIPTLPTNESPNYAHIFDKMGEEKGAIKAKEAAERAESVALTALARLRNDLCYTDIFHTLVAGGLITPLSLETDGSGFYNHTSYQRICEYHKGARGHSTENCSQLRLQVQKLIRDGIIKVEPPSLVIFQNKSLSPTKFES